MTKQQTVLTQGLVLLMATATGIAVASNYYAQPLLDTIASEFGLSHSSAGNIVTTAQLSYGIGLLFLVPLADRLERRKLIIVMSLFATIGLLISGFSTNLPWLLLGTAITGLSSVVAQVLLPLGATLASDQQRGKVIGTIMGGLLLGILLARVVSGGLSSMGSWRYIYWFASVAMFITTLALARFLPSYHNNNDMSYRQILVSVFGLFVKEPILRYRSILGMLSFALFSMFWTPLAFLLAKPPYEYSDATIGLFGLVGVAGVFAATWAGKLADAGKGDLGTRLGLLSLLVSWVILFNAPMSLVALLIGVLLLDLAVQLVHVSNQNKIYALHPDIRNRLTSAYMTCYFIGGAFGSWFSVMLYQHYEWTGVVMGATGIALIACILDFTVRKHTPK
ncbi:MAG TPA: MFS transporter [Methylophaga aminisulfidivorans]|uniref:MFS transporter n=1 Tax=Methylophaga TaxID=40222 RepID=UPI0017776027|nr:MULTISPECIES: MFS transporter [Methylophaga]WVI85443.1 MFS transporter [Methylophaga thalassica]HIC47133.1 MFS transporter [Methylophaga sp.]HIM39005.1 MFS transporter [Methylophaga aminisulfidivorans]